MPYMLEADVNSFGFLVGGDHHLKVAPAFHRWSDPYPAISEPLQVSWEPGALSTKPNIYVHNLLRDFVVDAAAFRALTRVADDDIRVYGKMILGGEELSVIQAIKILDVVDKEASIPSEYQNMEISFPHIPESSDAATRTRFFRVANRCLSLSVFVGDDVKEAYEEAGLKGWLFHEARVQPDDFGEC